MGCILRNVLVYVCSNRNHLHKNIVFIIIPISRDWLFMFRREQSHIISYIEILNLGSCRNRNIFHINLLQIYNFCPFFAVAKKCYFCFRAEYVSPTAHCLFGYSKATWQEAIFLFIPKVSKLVKSQNLWYKRVSLTVQFLICKMLTHGHLDHKSTHIHVEAFCYGWKKKSLTGLSIRASRRGSFENKALENKDRSTKHPKL